MQYVQQNNFEKVEAVCDSVLFWTLVIVHHHPVPCTSSPPAYTDDEGLHARSEVKRREQYLKKAEQLLGEEHSLVALVRQCLHNYPAQRPQTADLVTRLEGILGTLGWSGGMSSSQPAGQQHLCVDDLHVVMEGLSDVIAKWYNIGVQLGVSVGVLTAIKKQYLNDPTDCLRETLTTWLKSYPPPPPPPPSDPNMEQSCGSPKK